MIKFLITSLCQVGTWGDSCPPGACAPGLVQVLTGVVCPFRIPVYKPQEETQLSSSKGQFPGSCWGRGGGGGASSGRCASPNARLTCPSPSSWTRVCELNQPYTAQPVNSGSCEVLPSLCRLRKAVLCSREQPHRKHATRQGLETGGSHKSLRKSRVQT